MASDPEWLVLDDDGDPAGCVRAPTADDAVRLMFGDAADGSAIEVTPKIRRDWSNARRRERYAERRDAGELPSRTRHPIGFAFDLSFGAEMAIHDDRGRCRCPQCSRFCIRADFAKAPTGARFRMGDGTVACVTFGPACWRCRGLAQPPYHGCEMGPGMPLVDETEAAGGEP
jgi:hypothetical protein